MTPDDGDGLYEDACEGLCKENAVRNRLMLPMKVISHISSSHCSRNAANQMALRITRVPPDCELV